VIITTQVGIRASRLEREPKKVFRQRNFACRAKDGHALQPRKTRAKRDAGKNVGAEDKSGLYHGTSLDAAEKVGSMCFERGTFRCATREPRFLVVASASTEASLLLIKPRTSSLKIPIAILASVGLGFGANRMNTDDSRGRRLGWHWLWFGPICVAMLYRWSWGALLSPSAFFCLIVMATSIFWPIQGLALTASFVTADDEMPRRHLIAALLVAAVFVLPL
jgi:hypothetical protein